MIILEEIRKRASKMVLPVVGTSVILYLAYHTVHGDRGILAYMRLQTQVQDAELVYDTVRADRLSLQKKVQLLSPEGLDQDMLEETGGRVLNLVGENDILIMDLK